MTHPLQPAEPRHASGRSDVHISTCPSCGSLEFTVQETYYHAGDVDEDGVLFYDSDGTGGRERIQCAQCHRDFEESDFAGVEHG